jgi:hypothetical protein
MSFNYIDVFQLNILLKFINEYKFRKFTNKGITPKSCCFKIGTLFHFSTNEISFFREIHKV